MRWSHASTGKFPSAPLESLMQTLRLAAWSLAQVCTSSFPQALILMVERLYILDGSFGLH